MNCPVCNRNNTVTLSICPSCGAMINDSVREEHKPKVLSLPRRVNFEVKGNSPVPKKSNQQTIAAEPPKPAELKPPPAEIAAKPTTPTLVEFHTTTATIPEWRLQLQNSVRRRQECNKTDAPAVQQTRLVTNGATALKAEVVAEAETFQHENTTLNSALQRIEESRQKFFVEEKPPTTAVNSAPTATKNYPFYIASKQTEVPPKPASKNVPVTVPTKPKLAASLKIDVEPVDTDKLPLPKAATVSSSFAKSSVNFIEAEKEKIKIKPLEIEEIVETDEEIYEEIDDCAPIALRFNAGLFDLIIGAFLSLLLLAPFVMLGGSWFTLAGVLAFLATCAIVMFIYLTTAVGMFGRTFGMRLFSLEVVDIEGEEYPTLHQAAVSSSVYLLSLAFGGIGFLTLPFNQEKRAVHDLVSGTIVVREY